MNLRCEVHNEFSFVLRDAKTGKIKQKAKSYNIVTNLYFAKIRNSTSYITSLQVGKGTGTPSVTNYNLFDYVASKGFSTSTALYLNEPGQEYLNAWKRVTIFNENEANADITEVGLADSNQGSLWTHSLITDSEGQPTTVHKTSTDTLEITSIVYSKIIGSGFIQPIRQVGVDSSFYGYSCQANPEFIQSGCSYSRLVQASLGGSGLGTSPTFLGSAISSPSHVSSLSNSEIQIGSGTRVITQDSKIRWSSPRVLAASMNGYRTYQLKSVYLTLPNGGNGYALFYISFSNHEIFPPVKLTFEKTGDGTTTDFNLGVPLLMEDSAHIAVKIDGVLQDPNTYDWYGRDYTFWQAWESADNLFLRSVKITNTSNWGSGARYFLPGCPGCAPGAYYKPATVNSSVAGTDYILYDFEEPIIISDVKSASSYDFLLQYSTDGNTWSDAIICQSHSTAHFSEITARYWRITNVPNRASGPGGFWWTDSLGSSNDFTSPNEITAFGRVRPQLSFHTAPPAGSVIQIEAYTEYPLKNSNWILDNIVIDMDFVRGSE